MRHLIAKTAIATAMMALIATPEFVSARQTRHYSNYAAERHAQSCHNARRRRANTGTAIGGIGGALAGNAIGHNLGGTLIGAGVGAVAGHAIADRRKGDC